MKKIILRVVELTNEEIRGSHSCFKKIMDYEFLGLEFYNDSFFLSGFYSLDFNEKDIKNGDFTCQQNFLKPQNCMNKTRRDQFIEIFDNTKWEELTKEEQEFYFFEKENWRGKRIFDNDILVSKYNKYYVVYFNNEKGCFEFIQIRGEKNIIPFKEQSIHKFKKTNEIYIG